MGDLKVARVVMLLFLLDAREGVSNMKRWEIYLEIFLELLIFVAIVAFIGFGAPKLIVFFWPIVLAAILAAITNPLKNILERHLKIPNRVGATLMVILLLGLVALAIYGVIMAIVTGGSYLVGIMPEVYQDVVQAADAFIEDLIVFVGGFNASLADSLKNLWMTLGEEIGSFVAKIGTENIGHITGFATSVTNVIIGIIVMFLAAYFLLIYKDDMVHFYENIQDKELKQKMDLIGTNVFGSVIQYIFAQIKLMMIIALILLVGLLILQAGHPLLLAILIAILDAIPFLGTGTALIPWAVVAIFQGKFFLGVGLIVLYVICLLSRQLLQPKIIGETVGLNPFVTLILMYVGTKIAGIVGFIVAVLLGIIVYKLYLNGFFNGMIARTKRRFAMLREMD